MLAAGEFLQPTFIDKIDLGTDEHDQPFSVLAGFFVGDHLRRVAADAADRAPIGDDERLLVAVGDERRIELRGVQPVRLELEIRDAANVLLERLLVGRPSALLSDRTVQVKVGERLELERCLLYTSDAADE